MDIITLLVPFIFCDISFKYLHYHIQHSDSVYYKKFVHWIFFVSYCITWNYMMCNFMYNYSAIDLAVIVANWIFRVLTVAWLIISFLNFFSNYNFSKIAFWRFDSLKHRLFWGHKLCDCLAAHFLVEK